MSFDLRDRSRQVKRLQRAGRREAVPFARRGICFLQDDMVIANGSGATVRADVNNNLQALATIFSGASAPATTYAYMCWADTTNGLLKQRNAANTGWLIRDTLAETRLVSRSSNTIFGVADFAKTFTCTSTFTQTLTAAATLADGWFCYVKNAGAGVITLDPNGAETIDGVATVALAVGEGCLVFCNGTAFYTIGRWPTTTAPDLPDYATNFTIATSRAGSAETIALKTKAGADPSASDPVYIAFRNATAGTGDYSLLTLTAATSLVISSGSTLGLSNGVAGRLWLVGFNDAGTFRLGIVNCLSGTNIMPLRDDLLLSSTAEGGAGAADSAQVIYTGTAVTAKALRVLGYLEYNLATAGTWGTAPTKVQLAGQGVPLPGSVIQSQRTATGTMATGTTTIPVDNTIPQSTEGTQFMSQAITPTSAANLLSISSQTQMANSAAGSPTIVAALFIDAGTDALAAAPETTSAALLNTIPLAHRMLAGSTSARTLKIRGGGDTAGTTTFNGSGGAAYYGGVINSFLQVDEVMT